MEPKTNLSTGYRFYSFGIVIEDKTDNDEDYIKATPIEELQLVKGKLKDIKFDYTVSGVDHKGVVKNHTASGVSYIVAKWAPFENNNRVTAPNVCEGETVILLKYANTDDIYWTEFFREPGIRRLEHVVYAFSDLKEKGSAYNDDTSYWVKYSTRDKYVHLHTSNNDEEPVGYDFKFDTLNGTFELSDTNKNYVKLDSVNGDLSIKTNRSIELNSPQIRINGEEYVRTTAPEITDTANDSASYISEGSWTADAASKVDILKPTYVDGDVLAGDISAQNHTHDYLPGNGSPTPSQKPNP